MQPPFSLRRTTVIRGIVVDPFGRSGFIIVTIS